MAAGLKNFDFVKEDYGDILLDLTQIVQRYYPENTDFEHDNAGTMLNELFSYITQLLFYKINHVANESFLPTAQERQSVINIAKSIGYTLSPSSPAQVEVTFTTQDPQDKRVIIPMGTVLSTADKLNFELDQDIIFLPGVMEASGSATEGLTYSEVFSEPSGEANQVYYLSRTGVISVKAVYVADVRWAETESLAYSGPLSREYALEVDALGKAMIVFGDGFNGLPPADGTIEVIYRIGGGKSGNIAANTLVNMQNTARDEAGNLVLLEVTNPKAATGGAEPESIEHAKLWAPKFYETQGRLVTETDYETAANTFYDLEAGRIIKAKAVIGERSGEVNQVKIYALSNGPENVPVPPTDALKKSFINSIDGRYMLTDTVEMYDGKTRSVDIEGTFKPLTGFREQEVIENMKTSLAKLLHTDNRDMKQELRYSDVYAALDETQGVDWVELDKPTKTVMAEVSELLILGNVSMKAVE